MLTDIAIRKAKPANKPFRMFEGGGLYLEVSPPGGKLWRLKYRFEGKEHAANSFAFIAEEWLANPNTKIRTVPGYGEQHHRPLWLCRQNRADRTTLEVCEGNDKVKGNNCDRPSFSLSLLR